MWKTLSNTNIMDFIENYGFDLTINNDFPFVYVSTSSVISSISHIYLWVTGQTFGWLGYLHHQPMKVIGSTILMEK